VDLSRNWGLISRETQEKIENATIFCAGCGLGALIATIATRIGFKHFILADGDKVEASNLNRQPFFLEHVGKNKAEVTSQLIKSINPEAKVQVLPRFLKTREEIIYLVWKSNFVVNTVDPDETFWLLTDISRNLRRVEFHPLNVGWYSFVYVSYPNTPPLEEIVGGKIKGFDLYKKLVMNLAPSVTLPSEVMEKLEKIEKGEIPIPQIAITSTNTANLVISVMIKILEGEAPLYPNPVVYRN
jgi:molybdopterin/thiamine biosynthesis adenylyltransferase